MLNDIHASSSGQQSIDKRVGLICWIFTFFHKLKDWAMFLLSAHKEKIGDYYLHGVWWVLAIGPGGCKFRKVVEGKKTHRLACKGSRRTWGVFLFAEVYIREVSVMAWGLIYVIQCIARWSRRFGLVACPKFRPLDNALECGLDLFEGHFESQNDLHWNCHWVRICARGECWNCPYVGCRNGLCILLFCTRGGVLFAEVYIREGPVWTQNREVVTSCVAPPPQAQVLARARKQTPCASLTGSGQVLASRRGKVKSTFLSETGKRDAPKVDRINGTCAAGKWFPWCAHVCRYV